MTQHDNSELKAVEALLAEAARKPDELPPGLAARVLADARRVQSPAPAARPRPAGGAFARFLQALGGWPTLSGLAAATCAGFWIGIDPPAGVPDAAVMLWGGEEYANSDEAAELTGFGWDLEEGL